MTTYQSDKTVLTAQQARQGKELGVVRYILAISLMLSVIAGIAIYGIFFF
jgi:hypothetical protein